MRTLTLLLLVACATEPVSKPTPEPAWAQDPPRLLEVEDLRLNSGGKRRE